MEFRVVVALVTILQLVVNTCRAEAAVLLIWAVSAGPPVVFN
jgi:hypothetical protein